MKAKVEGGLLLLWCPGCQDVHMPRVSGPGAWEWNFDLEKPTLSPSIMVDRGREDRQCHSFMQNGQWHFLPDCHHELRGKIVDLPELPE